MAQSDNNHAAIAPDGSKFEPGSADARATAQKLAYEHAMTIEIEEDKIVASLKKIEELCRADQANECVILKSSVSSRTNSHQGMLKLRAKPDGVRAIMRAAGAEGKVREQDTTAEDLAAPIADTEKQLALLKDYREHLMKIADKGGLDVDALIKLNKELATVQSDIEAAGGRFAHLTQRVNTEILSVTLESRSEHSASKPLSSALSSFAEDLSHGIASVITGMAFIVPWLLALLILFVPMRWVWRKLRRKQQ